MLDTNVALWWQADHPRIRRIRTLVESNLEPVFVSQVSLWEVTIKASIGKLAVDPVLFQAQVGAMGFSWLRTTKEHILHLLQLPAVRGHADPFDRLLVAQAASESVIFLTADAALIPHGDFVRVL